MLRLPNRSLDLVCGVALLTFAAGLAATDAVADEPSTRSAFPVHTDTIHYEMIKRTLHSSGKLVNKSEQRLSFKTSGQLKKVYVDEGDYVKKGQLLAELDQAEIAAQVSQAKSLEQDAQLTLARLRKLYQQQVIPKAQLQTAETNAEVTASNLRIAQFNQKHAKIEAPANGTVLRRFLEENEFVAPFQPALVLGAEQQGWIIRSKISDKDIVRVSVGDSAQIQFDAYPGISFSGFVAEIAGAANEQNQLFEIEIALDGSDQKLYSGFIGQFEISPQAEERIAWVPVEAVVEAKMGKAKLFKVLANHQVMLQEVTIGWLDSGKIAVRSGLENDSQIVTQGATFLSEGTLISSAN